MAKTGCRLPFIWGSPRALGNKYLVLDLKNRSLLVRRLSIAEPILTRRCQMCEKRLARIKAKFAYGLEKRYHNVCKC